MKIYSQQRHFTRISKCKEENFTQCNRKKDTERVQKKMQGKEERISELQERTKEITQSGKQRKQIKQIEPWGLLCL